MKKYINASYTLIGWHIQGYNSQIKTVFDTNNWRDCWSLGRPTHFSVGYLAHSTKILLYAFAFGVFHIFGLTEAWADRHETRESAQHLVKTSLTFDLITAEPPADFVFAECATESFKRNERPIEFAGSEPARSTDPFSLNTCPWPSGLDHSRYIGRFFPRSLNDLGTYTIRCTNIEARGPPYLREWIENSYVGGCPPPNRLLLGGIVAPRKDHVIEFEVFNFPPTISISHDGTNVLPTGEVAYNGNIDITANARDPDGGDVTVSWIVERPAGARGIVGPLLEPVLNVRFQDESDFGIWRFQAIADDNEGERVRSDYYTVNVVNQNPHPVISGSTRVPFGMPIDLSVSPDEDGGEYSYIRWEVYVPGSVGWAVVGESTRMLTMPTDISSAGEWRFRVQVTDNDNPPLTGNSTEYVVEVYNEPPQLTLESFEERVPEHDGAIVIAASAVDPDGGDVQLTIRAFQVPNTGSIPVGTVVASNYNNIRYAHTTRNGDAGTWIFEVTATDDEPPPWQETDKRKAIVLVDGLPSAEINGPERVGSLRGMLELTSDDIDPDSPCEDDEPTNRCHSTADGSPVSDISPSIVRWVWTLVDATLDDFSYFPIGNVRDVFDIPGDSARIELPPEKLKSGLFTFQLEVEDGEANIGEAFHQVEVIEENTKPLAIVSPPARHIISVFGATPADIAVSGAYSFDPDNILTGNLPGIESYDWSLVYGPEDCISLGTAPVLSLYRAGNTVPTGCQSIYALNLTVTDDDQPMGRTANSETAISIGTCPGTVCIDLPTSTLPQIVEFSDDTDVLILYHIDPSVAAAFPFGMSARLDIFHESSLSPVFTSYNPNVYTTALTPLLVFHWNGYWFAERPRAGRYSIQISLVDHVLNPAGLLFQAWEDNAILIEVDELKIASDADRYISRKVLEDRTDTVSIGYKITGRIMPDRTEWRLIDNAGAIVFHETLPPDQVSVLNWDGRVNHSDIVPPGHYTVELESFRGTASLTGVVRHPLTIYELQLEPITASEELILMVNNDDDNLNGIADGAEAGTVTGENDLVGVNIIINPPIEGRLTLTTTDPTSHLKFYAQPDRSGGETEHIPGVIYLEGVAAGDGNLRLQLQPSDTSVLLSVNTTVSVVEIAVEDNAFTRVSALNIATWENAYQFAVPFPVRNTTIDNFIDREDRKFYVRVIDSRANTGPTPVETAVAEIWTVFDSGITDDDPTPITLWRHGTGGQAPNSDSLQSNVQILVTPDLPANPDDDFRAHDGAHDLRNDDEQDDRTHRATIDGAVRISYRPMGGPLLDFTVPVCERSPETRRLIDIRAWIFIDPRSGLPSATQAFVDAQVRRANIAWSPACLKFRLVSSPTIVSAPTVATPMGDVNILADMGTFDYSRDYEALISAYVGSAQIDRFELFVVPHISGANGVTYGPYANLASLGLNTFIVMSSNTSNPRTLAHELGHALGNTPDYHNFTYVFYPSTNWESGDPMPRYPRILDDTSISSYRRVFDQDIANARIDRALVHATPGDTTSPPPPPNARGNYALKIP